jgi:hypothetical protein
MAEGFDPYRNWLGLAVGGREPNHYELLSLAVFEADKSRINEAADRAAQLVTSQATTAQVPQSQKLLYQISTARVCLLNAAEKARYDDQLRQQQSQLKAEMPVAKAPPAAVQRIREMQSPAAPPPAATASMPPPMPAPVYGTVPVAPAPAASMPAPATNSLPAPSPAVRIVGGAEEVVARVKQVQENSPLDLPGPARLIRKRQRMSWETLGVITILCLLVSGLGIFAIYSVTKKDSNSHAANRKTEDAQSKRDKTPLDAEQVPEEPKQERPLGAWADAASMPAQVGSAKVSIIRAFAGVMPGVPGAKDYLFVQVRVRNVDEAEPLAVERWESWAARSVRHNAVATDETGTHFLRTNPFRKRLTTGTISLEPNQRVDQFLVFKRPPENVQQVRLTLAGKAVGAESSIRFEIPASMIMEADAKLLAWLYASLPAEKLKKSASAKTAAHSDPAAEAVGTAVGAQANSE